MSILHRSIGFTIPLLPNFYPYNVRCGFIYYIHSTHISPIFTSPKNEFIQPLVFLYEQMADSNKNTPPPSFQTPVGEIIGWYDGEVIKATGIRYARSKRFQAPVPEPASPTPILANKRTGCPQISVPFIEDLFGEKASPDFVVDESCQYLSITLPAHNPVENLLPVMIWIHGGSYHIGSADLQTSNPKLLVQEQQVIVVSVNYRLGLFGFLGGYDHRPANLGLLDIREAIRWVKKNIQAFGGNPENLTLVGQSAGGDAIAHLMIAEGSEDLFQRVIIQSAPLGITRSRQKMSREFSSNTAHLTQATPVSEILAHSTSQAPSVLKYGLKAGMPMGLQYGFAPLPTEDKSDQAWAKVATQYQVLIGSTQDETSMFTQISPRLKKLARLSFFKTMFIRPLIRYTTRKIYAQAAHRFATNHAKAGGTAYVYKIHWGSKKLRLGAAHCIDLALLFGGEVWEKSNLVKNMEADELLQHGRELRAIWAQFARHGTMPAAENIDPHLLTYEKINPSAVS
jgi:para-nitrobenzyl esterase